jgi:hypothetical protein
LGELTIDQPLELLLRELDEPRQRTIVARVGAAQHHLELVALEQRLRGEPTGQLGELHAHARCVATGGRDQILEAGGGSHPQSAREQLDARRRPEPHHAAHGAATKRSARSIEGELGIRRATVDDDGQRGVGIVATMQVARALPHRVVDPMLQPPVATGALEDDLGAGPFERRDARRMLERSVEPQAPAFTVARARSDDDRRRIETEHRPEPDAELARLVLGILFGRGVEREQIAARMIEGHAFAVVVAHDDLAAAALVHRERDLPRSRVARVLQQLADEDPRIGSVAIRLEPGALAKRL